MSGPLNRLVAVDKFDPAGAEIWFEGAVALTVDMGLEELDQFLHRGALTVSRGGLTPHHSNHQESQAGVEVSHLNDPSKNRPGRRLLIGNALFHALRYRLRQGPGTAYPFRSVEIT